MRNKALKVLFISNRVFVFANSQLGPLYAIFIEKFDVSVVSISGSWALYMFSATIFTLLVSKVGDMVKEQEYLLLSGYLIRVFCWLAYIMIGSFLGFLLIQVVLGISEALAAPAFDAIFARHLDQNQEVREYATWKLYQNGAVTLATVAGGVIVQASSFEALFVLMSIVTLVLIACLLRQDRDLLYIFKFQS